MAPPPVARNALEKFGIEAICQAITDGKSLTLIAKQIGVGRGRVIEWIAADVDRSARARNARRASAWHWDELAEAELRNAERTTEDVAIARELASHFRWRARQINPDDYGEKVDVNHRGAIGITPLPISYADLADDTIKTIDSVLLLARPAPDEHKDEDK